MPQAVSSLYKGGLSSTLALALASSPLAAVNKGHGQVSCFSSIGLPKGDLGATLQNAAADEG